MMSMIIQGPKQPGNDIDIYFQLLVEELLTVWIDAPAVKCYDAYRKEIFDLHAMLVHTIEDLPTLGTHGRKQREMLGVSHAWIGQLAEDFPTRAKQCICVIVGSYGKLTHIER